MKIHAIKGQIKRQYHWYYKHLCSECGCLHWYRKWGKPEDRYDGRKCKHLCFDGYKPIQDNQPALFDSVHLMAMIKQS